MSPDPLLASARFLERIPRSFARDHGLLSQGDHPDQAGAELVLTVDGCDPTAVWNLAVRLERPVVTRTTASEGLQAAIDAAYERAAAAANHQDDVADAASATAEVTTTDEDFERLLEEADRDLLATDGKAPVVRLLDRLLFAAVTADASDIHLLPAQDHVLLRHRVDGILDAGRTLPINLHRPLMSRLKVLGGMDVAEHLAPQDGRTSLRIGGRTIDVRISAVPTVYGERAVLRLLDAGRQLKTVPSLGMAPAIETAFMAAAQRASGIILVTGPTGSGKSTTLYAVLQSLDAVERNIMTIEDPVEYRLSSLGLPIGQSQVNTTKGLSFANGLRHLLRQDPDVILVGEIRDTETARMAIQASLTGHLVLSTLHTNDAVSAVTRLIDLGVEPYLVAASLSAVLAQRLVRTCCNGCGGKGTTGDGPCPTCRGSGYRGRTGLFELLEVTETVRHAITEGGRIAELRQAALANGMTTLADDGQRLIVAGRTTPAEVARVIHHG